MTRDRIIAACLLLGAALFPLHTSAAPAQDEELRREIAGLLIDTGASQLGQQVGEQVAAAILQTNPNLSAQAQTIIQEELSGALRDFMPQIEELTIEAYANHFTVEEIRELRDFYQTDIGRKVTARMPEIVAESSAASQVLLPQFIQSLLPKILERVKRETQETIRL